MNENIVQISSVMNGGYLQVRLSQSEISMLCKVSDQNSGEDYLSTGSLGYIDPSKIESYFVKDILKEFMGSPKLSVFIRPPDEHDAGLIGSYYFIHTEEGKEFVILGGPILKGDRPDPKYIERDESGMFVPITEEAVMKVIKEGEEQLKRSVSVYDVINTAKKMAKLAGLEMDKEISVLVEHNDRFELERYQAELPNTVAQISESLRVANFMSGYDDETEMFNDEIHERIRNAEELLGKLPKLKLETVEVRDGVRSIIGSLLRINQDASNGQLNDLREAAADIKHLRGEKTRLEHVLKSIG